MVEPVYFVVQIPSNSSSWSWTSCFQPKTKGSRGDAAIESGLSRIERSFLGPFFQLVKHDPCQPLDVGQEFFAILVRSAINLHIRPTHWSTYLKPKACMRSYAHLRFKDPS